MQIKTQGDVTTSIRMAKTKQYQVALMGMRNRYTENGSSQSRTVWHYLAQLKVKHPTTQQCPPYIWIP